MNQKEYDEYVKSVDRFFEKEGINCLSTSPDYGDNIEPHFSWYWCDCCSRDLGGNRYDCCGYNPTTKEIQDGYSICEDCLYFATYGQLDDMTMLDLETGE